MGDDVSIPRDLWRDIRDFFLPFIAGCKDCVRGNLYACWHGDCAAFRFRNIARRISSVQAGCAPIKPNCALVEDEILSALALYDRPVPPSRVVLESTRSKANKYSAIRRLVRMGQVAETFTPNGSRLISLPPREKPRNKK